MNFNNSRLVDHKPMKFLNFCSIHVPFCNHSKIFNRLFQTWMKFRNKIYPAFLFPFSIYYLVNSPSVSKDLNASELNFWSSITEVKKWKYLNFCLVLFFFFLQKTIITTRNTFWIIIIIIIIVMIIIIIIKTITIIITVVVLMIQQNTFPNITTVSVKLGHGHKSFITWSLLL